MLSDNQEQEGCTTRELVGLCVCVCVCVRPMLSFHTPRVQFIQAIKPKWCEMYKTQKRSGAYTTHHTQQKATLQMTVVFVSHSLGLIRHVHLIHTLTSVGKLRTVLEEELHHNSELCRTRSVLQLRCSCGNQKQINSPVNLSPQNYILCSQAALSLWRHNTRKREVHSPMCSPVSQLKQQTQGARAS
jgi:hypothetical protein